MMMDRSQLDRTLLAKQKITKKTVGKIKKLNAFETYIALIKGYCCAVLLFLPKAYANGGWLFANFCIIASGVFTGICA